MRNEQLGFLLVAFPSVGDKKGVGQKFQYKKQLAHCKQFLYFFKGFVRKTGDAQHGSKYVYEPTQKAIDLLPILLEIARWSAKYDPHTAAPKSVVAKIKKDKIGYMKEIVASLQR